VISLAGAIVGLLAGVGLLLVVAGFRRHEAPAARRATIAWRAHWWRGVVILTAVVVGWWVRGWPAAGAMAGIVAWVAPLLVDARRRRETLMARAEALAAWTEMLRDTIAAQAGLREAIAVSARVAPAAIRAEVQALATRCERDTMTNALTRFAADLADPVADLVVAALLVAAERQARNLADLLGQIAGSAREQTAMRIRVETGRARTYATAKWMVILTGITAAALLVYGADFMRPYDTAAGQAVLLVIGGLFGLALFGLVQLGRPAAAPRLLSGVDGRPPW
jgi:uncharacterized integral membrane protein